MLSLILLTPRSKNTIPIPLTTVSSSNSDNEIKLGHPKGCPDPTGVRSTQS